MTQPFSDPITPEQREAALKTMAQIDSDLRGVLKVQIEVHGIEPVTVAVVSLVASLICAAPTGVRAKLLEAFHESIRLTDEFRAAVAAEAEQPQK